MTALLLNIRLHLRVVGILLLLLATMHLFLPRRFAWREELARLSLLNRQIFIVHCLFIVLLLLLTGVLSLCFAPLLAQQSPLSAVILAGLALFWLARLAAQFFLYSPMLWRGNRFNTTMHIFFTCLWTYFTLVYASASYSAMT